MIAFITSTMFLPRSDLDGLAELNSQTWFRNSFWEYSSSESGQHGIEIDVMLVRRVVKAT